MLEDIYTTPEDRHTVNAILDVSLVVFGAASLADGLLMNSGAAPILVGVVTAAAGLASMAWLRLPRRVAARA
jgi:hypothetical protein